MYVTSFQDLEEARYQQNITPGAPGVDTGSESIANNYNTLALSREIGIVKDLIERCLQLYMNKDEVVKTLLEQARIEPGFTSIVWDRLGQENAEFFKAYHTKLILKEQITMFNELLEKHCHLLNFTAPLEAPLAPVEEVIQHMPVNHLHKGHTLLQQQPILSTGHPQNDSMGTISNYDLVNENPECGNFHSTQMNYGRWMPMDNNTADIAPIRPLIKSEIPSPVSVASHDPFSFIPEMPEIVDPSAFEFAELSHVRSGRQVLPGPGNAGFSNVEVKEFFADTIPAPGSLSEEES
ncbi:unnamed protein product [Dovyalis caffra]|uniref:Uncharacterized protein n=1 Tax=Dovyalis caffra TaxID=77055 RepID=A0AAV1QV32_9ROSI|nr:unnamed protein product [Dovyalis caffra]